MKSPTQPELGLENPDFRVETVFVDELQAATDKLRDDGFQVASWEWLIGKGRYRLHATRVNRPGPDLDAVLTAPSP